MSDMVTRFIAATLLLIGVLAAPSLAQERTFTFTGTDAEFSNPERGWRTGSGGAALEDFSSTDAARVVRNGIRVMLVGVMLRDYRDRPIPQSLIDRLDHGFGILRKHGLKITLRFLYTSPGSPGDTGEDAPLDIVLGHIKQVGPLITRNADTIVAMEAGFIGRWGEQHGSTNGLDSAENKLKIRDALYAVVPKSLQVVWRYPGTLMAWPDDTRSGFHNDCFLSSTTDVGTYSGTPASRDAEKAAMEARTATTFFIAEVCANNGHNAGPVNDARWGCDDIRSEGARYHLSLMNLNFYTKFHDGWRAQGCFDEISRKMGYRLQLGQLKIGSKGGISLQVTNTGWARPIQKRPIVVTTHTRGIQIGKITLKGDLNSVEPGETVAFTGTVSRITVVDKLCFSAPDTSPRLANIPGYAIRFANADTQSTGWDAALSAFCISGIKRR